MEDLVWMDKQGSLDQKGLPEFLGTQVFQVKKEKAETLDVLEYLEIKEDQDPVDHQENPVPMEYLAYPGFAVILAQMEIPASAASQETMDSPESQDSKAKMVYPESLEEMDVLEMKDSKELGESQDLGDSPGSLETLETRGILVSLVMTVSLEAWAQMVCPDSLAGLGQRVCLEIPARGLMEPLA